MKAPRAQLFVTDAGGDHTERIRWPKAGIQVYACTGASRHLPAAVGAFQVMGARREALPPRKVARPYYQGQAWQPSCPQAKLRHSPEFARPFRGTNEYSTPRRLDTRTATHRHGRTHNHCRCGCGARRSDVGPSRRPRWRIVGIGTCPLSQVRVSCCTPCGGRPYRGLLADAGSNWGLLRRSQCMKQAIGWAVS